MKPKQKQPPTSTRYSQSWNPLEQAQPPETWLIEPKEGEAFEVRFPANGTLRVFKTLVKAPLACPSRLRISDRILILRRDYGLNITTEMYPGNGQSECQRFGVYFLEDKATRVSDHEEAAA
mgnify:CR=1 FL=1